MTSALFDLAVVRRRTRAVLVAGQALAGIGMGATVSAGALLATEVSGSEAYSGAATTGSTVGSALAAIPLAALALRRGRAPALAAGSLCAAAGAGVGILASILGLFPMLVVGFVLIGVGTAVNLQARFAATDLADPARRARDLSLVVWATTLGAIVGPNLIGAGNSVGLAVGLPDLAGPLLLTAGAQLLAAAVYLVGLRPDPLRLARRVSPAMSPSASPRAADDGRRARTGIAILALSHATMASVMAMTPVHLASAGADLEIVGLTISLHIAGMYALSPVFGALADRIGPPAVIVAGQVTLAGGLLTAALGSASPLAVGVGLVLLGLGWSASTVAASALVATATAPERRTRVQGRSDAVMSGAGALGAALAGPVLAVLGYPGLSLAVLALVAAATVLLLLRGRPAPRPA